MKKLISPEDIDFIISYKHIAVTCDRQIAWVSKSDRIAEVANMVDIVEIYFPVQGNSFNYILLRLSRTEILALAEEIKTIESIKLKPEFIEPELPF